MKYVRKFDNQTDYNIYKIITNNNALCGYVNNGNLIIEQEPVIPIPNDEIWYTSTDGNTVTPTSLDIFGDYDVVRVINNTYSNGKGILKCDGNVTIIGNHAFYEANTLQSIKIPQTVTTIAESAFEECENLVSIDLNNTTTIEDYAFYFCTSLNSLTIPNTLTSIGQFAFYNCSGLTGNLTIPNTITSIGQDAFSTCIGLTSLVINSNSNTIIRQNAFEDCMGLTSLTINGDFVFNDSGYFLKSALETITIGSSVTNINKFYSSTKVKSITVLNTTPPAIDRIVLANLCGTETKIYVPAGYVDTYKTDNYWKYQSSKIRAIPA